MRLLIFVALIVLALYIYGYFRFPKTVAILQTNEQRFKSEILLERQPVVFEDAPSHEFIKRVFRWAVTQEARRETMGEWHHNKYKYKAFFVTETTEVMLCPPTAKTIEGAPVADEELIAIQCKPGNVVIIPYRWHYMCQTPCESIGMHDLITYLIP